MRSCVNRTPGTTTYPLRIHIHLLKKFASGIVRELVEVRRAKNIFTPEFASKTLAVVDNPADGVWFAAKMVGFIVGDLATDL
ncbi:hypothetical protein BDK51DRAFT_36605 [Blyttiomyces helicus]|uniref:Uncharacterized protein n=1 Tax=Blyttiomyces helicus TaxID=388810 RepID=A0A4P9VTT9_9FUNG|nr:hypothetical protein BDK51DRAFT_36605 [Blyttiomyces helicus]|eukprot:RKO82959.1 hypothetical protein BDK51DRAFT_36605 [Blyttiomyces helicus]